MVHIGEVWVHNEHDIPLVRQRMQKLARLAKLTIGNQARLTTTVSQVVESLYYYCRCVHVSFDVMENEEDFWLQATISEEQENSVDPDTRVESRLSRDDLLTWLEGLQMFVHSYSIRCEDKQPIKVVAAKPFPSWQKSVEEETLRSWGEALRDEAPKSAVEAILQRNQALLLVLNDLRDKEADLQQKVSEVQALELMRDDLVHALVHDLRSPLASIRSSLSGLLFDDSADLSEYQQAMIEISYQAAKNMGGLVTNILGVYRLERDPFTIEPEWFSLAELAEEILQLQTPLAHEKNIQVRLESSGNLPPIQADRELTGRMLQNLLDNALKFTPENGVVGISIEELTPGASKPGLGKPIPTLILRVADSGPGITDEIKQHLFEKFSTGSLEESGSGIGLAFCKLVVLAHEGEIWVEKSPYGGASFAVMLPLRQQQITGKSENG